MNAQNAIDTEIQGAIDVYLKARAALRAMGEKYPESMRGNDNLKGRIGEFMALRYFEGQGRSPKKVGGGHSSTNPGSDLEEGDARLQVKVITHENKHGSSTRLKAPWTEFLLIELGSDYRQSRIGHLREQDHVRARDENAGMSKSPVVRRSMLDTRGLIGRYGKVTRAAGHASEPIR